MAVIIGALALPGSPAQAAPVTPEINIDGTAPFADGQTVTVHGSGLTPGVELFVEECESTSICNVRVGGPRVVASDGTVTMTAALTRYFLDFFSNYGDTPVDCSTASCRLGLVALDAQAEDGYRVVASSLIAFDTTSAWHPVVSVTPSTSLPPFATLHITGQGFAPASRALARFCSTFGCGDEALGTTSATGDLDLSLPVTRVGQFWDCLADPCSVQVLDSRSVVVSETRLEFDPSQVAVVPQLSVTPDHDLALHDTVTVHGQHYSPGVTVRVNQCSDGSTTGTWSCPSSTMVTVAADGTFDASLAVDRYVTSEIGHPIDCAVPGHCRIETTGGSVYPVLTVAPITFAARTADPAIHLEGVTVVEGTGPAPTIATAHVVVDRPASAPIDVVWTASGFETPAKTFDDFGFRHEHAIIPAGASSAELTIPIVADAIDEPTESFDIYINTMTNAQITLDGDRATVTIVDDDKPPRVEVGDTIVSEGTGNAVVPVRLSAVSGRDVTVTYRTRRKSAKPGRDYVAIRGSVRIAAGTDSAEIQIPIVNDSRHEPTERFRVQLLDVQNGRLRDRQANVWIADDDARARGQGR